MNIPGLEDLKTEYEHAEYLQNLLISQATGGTSNNLHYAKLREKFTSNPDTANLLPKFVKTNRDLSQFWQFIKFEHSTYQARRDYVWGEFAKLLEYLESKNSLPSEKVIIETLERFDASGIRAAWTKALERQNQDPEGAITLSKSILESVCKHIIESKGIEYNKTSSDLTDLYKLVAKELNLAPEQHQEQIFKQILGGCSSIIGGLSAVRNKLGDAHGKGKNAQKPKARHAEFSINLSGAMAIFLIQTFEESQTK